GKMEIAVVVLSKSVAGDVPAVAHIRILPLVGEITAASRAADDELADFAARRFLEILADDLGLVAVHRLSGRARRGVAEPVGNKNVQHLGRTDAVENRLASFCSPFLEYRPRQGFAGRDSNAQR